MTLSSYDLSTLNDFFKATEFILPGYKHAVFNYFAVLQDGAFELTQARLLLQGEPSATIAKHFKSANIRAGNYRLEELNMTLKGLIEHLLSGVFPTPDGELRFPSEPERNHSLHFTEFADIEKLQGRQKKLFIQGANRRRTNEHINFNWELKASPTPFDNIQDLCNEYAVGSLSGSAISVEIIALNIVAIGAESVVKGTSAKLLLLLADGLERGKSSLGFQMFEKGKVTKRSVFLGDSLSWKTTNSVQRGEIELEVPAGAVLQCFASYSGEAQHQMWVADPSTTSNPRRAAYQTFDHNLESLNELIHSPRNKGQEARELEPAIASLLWMLGFSVTHTGAIPKTSETPDLMATTPLGHLAVIECTTGLLKADKLSQLVDRTERVKQNLANSGNTNVKILPIILTTKTREEVKANLDQAQKLGILVITREHIDEIIPYTLFFPNPDQLYIRAEESLKRSMTPFPFGGMQS